MKNNRFYQHRHEIKAIAETLNLSVTDAARALAAQEGWSGYTAELNAWDSLCIKYARAKYNKAMDHDGDGLVTLADIFA